MEYSELLKEAEKRYPIGTVFKIVHSPETICEVKNHKPYPVHDKKVINFYITNSIGYCEGASVYKDGNWAEIISLGIMKENYTYLIKLFKKLKIK